MKKTMIAFGIAFAMVVPAHAAGNIPGFETGSCAYPAQTPLPGTGRTLNVPAAYPTIQAAVNAAQTGDTVLLAAGTYSDLTEGAGTHWTGKIDGRKYASMVVVSTPGILIRGASRAGTVLDARKHDPNTGEVVTSGGLPVAAFEAGLLAEADNVVFENVTGHGFRYHAFYWDNVTGYWGRYLTAYNNGDYGVFAFGSRCGDFSYSYGSGNADSAFYIGECFPCDARIHHVDAEENSLGYSGTNAGGNLVIRDSIWVNNGIGIAPSSLDSEARPPQRGLTIMNNIVSHNNAKTAPATGIQASFWGLGIVIPGGVGNIITGNQVIDNGITGIVLSPIPDSNVYFASSNVVWGNVVKHDATAYPNSFDLAQGATSGPNNCWSDNDIGPNGTMAPPMLTTIWSCDVTAGTWVTPPGGDPRVEYKLVADVAGFPAQDVPGLGNIGGDERAPSPWQTWAAPTCTAHPSACVDAPNDGALGSWLPSLGLDA